MRAAADRRAAASREIVAAVLRDPAAHFSPVLSTVGPDGGLLHAGLYRDIWRTMVRLHADHGLAALTPSALTLSAPARVAATLGPYWAAELLAGVPMGLRLAPYLDTLRTEANRETVRTAAEAALAAVETADPARLALLAERLAGPVPAAAFAHSAPPWSSTAADWPETPWLIPHWVPAATTGLLVGRGGSGKSRLALQLAAAFAHPDAANASLTGRRWLPARGETLHAPDRLTLAPGVGGIVLLATWEDRIDTLGARLVRLADDGLADPEAIQARLHAVCLSGHPPLWEAPEGDGRAAALTPTGTALRAHAAAIGARLLIIDPVAAAYGGNENDRASVRRFINSFDRWAADHACTVMLIAHPPKTPAGHVLDPDRYYAGSTDWHNAPRWMIALRAEEVPDPDAPQIARTPPTIPVPVLLQAKLNVGPQTADAYLRPSPSGVGWLLSSLDAARDAAAARRDDLARRKADAIR